MTRRSATAIALCLAAASAPACGDDGDTAGGDDTADHDAGVPGAPDASPSPVDECGDVRVAPFVYYGTESPTYVPLTPGQILAVGTWGGCSGTLIAPTWVLTADHCGLSAGDSFCIGEDPANANRCLDAVRVVDNPDSDMTLAELEGDARDALPGVEPIPILTEAMDSSWLGRTAEAAGYGQQEDGGYGEREFTAEPIVDLNGHIMTIDGEGRHGVCFGDSGGPVMVVATDGTVRVAGDLSNGDGSCVDRDNYTRVDQSIDWIEAFTGPTVVDGAGCGAITPVGRCMSGGMAMWCGADDKLQTDSCPAAGKSCGWDAAAAGFRCIDGADSCGGVDAFGTCDGSVAQWCEGGVPKSRDCGSCGEICVLELSAGGAACAPDPCMGLDYLGRCVGTVAEWCDNGQLASYDCANDGKVCDYIDDQLGYWCR